MVQKYRIQMAVAATTLLLVVFLSLYAGSADGAMAFSNVIAQFSLGAFVFYIGLEWILQRIVGKYRAHMIAIVIAYGLLAYLIYAFANQPIDLSF